MTTANYMQRVFDALRRAPHCMTIDELAATLHLERRVVASAIDRLRRLRQLVSVCSNREWRYGLRPSAHRPLDTRGQHRTEEQQA